VVLPGCGVWNYSAGRVGEGASRLTIDAVGVATCGLIDRQLVVEYRLSAPFSHTRNLRSFGSYVHPSISSASTNPLLTRIYRTPLLSWPSEARTNSTIDSPIKPSDPRRSSGWRQERDAGTSRGLCGRRCCQRRRPASLRRSCPSGRLGCRYIALCWRWGRGCE
jgi:hypothetical protein